MKISTLKTEFIKNIPYDKNMMENNQNFMEIWVENCENCNISTFKTHL